MQVWSGSLKIQDAKSRQKIAIWAPSYNFVGPYLCNWGMYQLSEKYLLSSNISSRCPHNMANFGPLVPEIGPVVWGTPNLKFEWMLRLGSVTARHSSSGRQPNFAVLNRGCHLYLAGRPSRWALATFWFSYTTAWLLVRPHLDYCSSVWVEKEI